METNSIIAAIKAIFNGADERDWRKVRAALADDVWFDYQSLSDIPAAHLSADEVVDYWQNFLPGFDSTHHQLFGFDIEDNGPRAVVRFEGKVDHFIGDKAWTVEGVYLAELRQIKGHWQVDMLQFNLQKQSGNAGLAATATERMRPVRTQTGY
ncbi:MAG: nuclear transport factor 2 family protein [Bacteroidetes bacterium]|nr:nuclear transport factor 2 family protein [Bacteroidota bacterium]